MNWYHILLVFALWVFSCTGKVNESAVFSFVEYMGNASEGMTYVFRDCCCTQEQKRDYKVWKYTACPIPGKWHINTQPGSRSFLFTTPAWLLSDVLFDSSEFILDSRKR